MPGPQGVKGNRGDIGGSGQIVFSVLLYVSSIFRDKRQTVFAEVFFLYFADSPWGRWGYKRTLGPLKVLQCFHLIKLSML